MYCDLKFAQIIKATYHKSHKNENSYSYDFSAVTEVSLSVFLPSKHGKLLALFCLNLWFKLVFPRDGTSRDKPGWDVQLSLCPGTKTFPLSRCPFVPGQEQQEKSRDKILCPGTSRGTKWPKNGQKNFFLKNFKSFCTGTGRDRGVCPGIFAPALVPG